MNTTTKQSMSIVTSLKMSFDTKKAIITCGHILNSEIKTIYIYNAKITLDSKTNNLKIVDKKENTYQFDFNSVRIESNESLGFTTISCKNENDILYCCTFF